jgi:hypothetical protein
MRSVNDMPHAVAKLLRRIGFVGKQPTRVPTKADAAAHLAKKMRDRRRKLRRSRDLAAFDIPLMRDAER